VIGPAFSIPRAFPVSLSGIPAVALILFLGLPLLGLLSRAASASGVLDALMRPIALEALKLSMVTTLVVLVVALALGSPLALLLARRRFRGIALLDSLVDLPIVLPPAVAGLALLLTFGRRGVLGTPLAALGIELPFTTAAVVLASLFVAAPLSAPALFGGAILCWARALGEFGATIMFAGQFMGRTQTMPLAIYAALESDLDAALGLSVLLLAISFLLLVFFRRWLQQAAYGVG
jgi:molybdate transport system permease protein